MSAIRSAVPELKWPLLYQSSILINIHHYSHSFVDTVPTLQVQIENQPNPSEWSCNPKSYITHRTLSHERGEHISSILAFAMQTGIRVVVNPVSNLYRPELTTSDLLLPLPAPLPVFLLLHKVAATSTLPDLKWGVSQALHRHCHRSNILQNTVLLKILL